MKNFDLPSNFACTGYCGGMSKNAFCFGLLLYCCHGNTNCLLVAKYLIFNSETVVKSAKCVALFLKSIKTLQPKS